MAKVKQAKEVSGSRKITPGRSELIFKEPYRKLSQSSGSSPTQEEKMRHL